MFTSTMYHCP